MSDKAAVPSNERDIVYCSFCGMSNVELPLHVLISACGVVICDSCVGVCRDILWQHRDTQWQRLKDLAP